MQELMSRHKTYNLSPRDCLKTCLFQKWQRMVAPPAEPTRQPTTKRRKRKNSTSSTSNSSAGNNANSTGSKKKTPAANLSLSSQDVMVVGEPTLMGGEFGDEDERLITRLENTQYDAANGMDDEEDFNNSPALGNSSPWNSKPPATQESKSENPPPQASHLAEVHCHKSESLHFEEREFSKTWVEYLGNKKEVHTCLKRIRLDLPILHKDFINNNDEEGENNGHDVTATELESFLTNSSEREKFASEPSSRSLTEEQHQRIERNKQLALERWQAKLLSNIQSLGNDLLEDTPRAQTVEEVNPGEDQEEESSDGLNMDILDSPLNAAADHTINEEEALKLGKTQLDQSFKNAP
ncbi:hypothetical protein MC885_003687 [Smutsia gigantea]|nr:hypothetical protein MC885_003687 [Smutsia gigantea]